MPISCSLSLDGPTLKLQASLFTLVNKRQNGVQGFRRAGIKPSELPHPDVISGWIEQQILAENKPSFEAYMDKLLVGLAHQSQLWANQIPKQLVLNILRMRYMSKVWGTKQFVLRLHENVIRADDFRFASIHESLRLYAGRTISELEWKIIEDFEKYIGRKEKPTTNPMVFVVKCK